MESLDGGRPQKRFDSWFDSTIVTRAGEDILARYDNWAIKELRRLKLVWSAWHKNTEIIVEGNNVIPGTEFGFREVRCTDTSKLRLFFLSLLWRAGTTDLVGFKVDVSAERLELLRRMLVLGSPSPRHIFPITLTQHVTRGDWHNAGPQVQYKTYSDAEKESNIRYYRFYLDGLVAHIDDETSDHLVDRWGKLAVGNSGDHFAVLSRPYEGSHQESWLNFHMDLAERNYPGLADRILNSAGQNLVRD